MRYGAVFPQTEIGSDLRVIRDYIQTAEALGFDYVVAYDHVLGANPDRPEGWRGPYTYQTPFHEVFTLFAYFAALTERIELMSGILILPQRQTALVAKQAAQVDLLSGGRLCLGVGIGWNAVEYEALGQDFHRRGKRIEEQVELLRLLWTQDLVTYEGTFDRVPDAGINPLPVQQPIPVWFGGMADVVLRRMARMGDGWVTNRMSHDEARAAIDRLHGYLRDAGRDPADFGIDVRINAAEHKPDSYADEIAVWAEMGVTQCALNTMRAGYTHPRQHIDALQAFAEAVGLSG